MTGLIQRISDIESVVLKTAVIIGIILLLVYGGLSVVGNIVLHKQTTGPAVPSAVKAPYQVLVMTTGDLLYSPEVREIRLGVFQLEGYYADLDGKYRWVKTPLVLDEGIWGHLVVSKR